MKFLALIAFVYISLPSFGGETYKVEVRVTDIKTDLPLEGIKVVFKTEDNYILLSTFTDKQGLAKLEKCSEKSVKIDAKSTNDDYSSGSTFFNKKYDLNNVKLIQLTNLKYYRDQIKELTENSKSPIDSLNISKVINCPDTVINPMFEGGQAELARFIMKNMNYPIRALEEGIGGRCYLRFYIDKEGNVSNITITRGIIECPECDYEALKVISKMPKWTPGECSGEKVGIFYNLPINFNIQ